MSNEREIENLMYRYAELLDLGQIEEMATLFEHAELVGPDGETKGGGSDAIAAIYQGFVRLYPDGTPATHHVTTNVIIEVAEDDQSATARSYFTVFQATDELQLQPIIAGRYHDSFRRIGGRWSFAQRKMLPHLIGDMSKHTNPGE